MKRKLTGMIAAVLLTAITVRAEDPETLAIGSMAPAFTLPGIDDTLHSLSDYADSKLLVIVFTANHCPTAQAYEQKLMHLASSFSPEEVQVVAISSNHPQSVCLEELGYSDLGDSFEEMKIRAADRGFNFPYLYDGDSQETAIAYGARATPHVFIFDRERKLRYTGRFDDTENPYEKVRNPDALNAIQALLKGRSVPVETTKAFGCSMKWISKMEWRKKLDTDWAAREVGLTGIDTEGLKALIKNESGKLRLVNVWATWCGPCVIEFPEIVDMQRMYGNRNFEVVTLSMDAPSKKTQVLGFLENRKAAMENHILEGEDRDVLINSIDPHWQGNLPYTVLLRPGGEAVYSHDGIMDPPEVRKAIVGELGRYYADDRE